MIKGLIYLLTNQINDKQYIGQTIDLHARTIAHKSHHRNVIDKAIDKHGWDNFNLEVLKTNIPEENLDERESYYIGKYNTYEGRGYNLTPGGDSLRGKDNPMYGKSMPQSARKKLSNAHLGKTLSEEHKRKLSKVRSGINNSRAKVNKKMANEIYNKYHNSDLTYKDLVEEYPIGTGTVGRIVKGEHWAIKALGLPKKNNKGEMNHPQAKVTSQIGREIFFEYHNKNKNGKDIAEEYSITKSTVSRIVNKNHWTTKDLEDSKCQRQRK